MSEFKNRLYSLTEGKKNILKSIYDLQISETELQYEILSISYDVVTNSSEINDLSELLASLSESEQLHAQISNMIYIYKAEVVQINAEISKLITYFK